MAAAKNGSQGGAPAQQLQGFMKEQLVEAQKRFQGIEEDAQRVLTNLLERGRESRKELEGLLQKVNAGELKLLETAGLKDLGKRAGEAGVEVRKKVGELQNRIVEAAGVASQSQIRELNKELHRLVKKVDTLVGKKGGKGEVRA